MMLRTRRLMVRALGVLAVGALVVGETLWAQGIPNPLVRPQRGAETVQPQQPATTAPSTGGQARGATAAPATRGATGGTGGGRAGSVGEGLPEERRGGDDPIADLLAGLYVSAVIGDRAVLRSLDVRTVPVLAGATLATGGTGGGGGGAAAGGAPAGGGGGGGSIAGLRSQVFIVRNGEVMSLFDRLRVLVRVRDTTVTLFNVTDVPAGQYDPLDLMDRGFPVAFRGSVDSVQALPPVPPVLIAPGQGVDGEAFERARNTSSDQRSGGGGNTNSNRGNSGGGLQGNP